jgi:hypothetical protein
MDFVTKLDYSNNRQIKQFELTETILSGRTDFGLPYSALTSGIDTSTIAITSVLSGVTSTFSGNTIVTNITFGDPRMVVASGSLEALTPGNSGATQNASGYEGINPTIIDGNSVFESYTGSSYDFTVTSMEQIAFNTYTGQSISNSVLILSGDSLDFSGRTIWVDVRGITRTKKLIILDQPELDNTLVNVLARNVDGEIREVYLSGYTNQDDYLTGGTFNTSTGVLNLNLLSGPTITINLDNRYSLTGHTHDMSEISGTTDNYVTGATFNTSDGVLTLAMLTGTTVTVDLDDRYSLTGHTHDMSEISGATDDYTTGATFNSEIITFTRQSGDTYNVDLSNTYSLTGHTHSEYLTGYTQTTPNLEEVTTVGNWTLNDIFITGTTEKELRTTNYTTNNYSRVTPNFVEVSNQANDSYFNVFNNQFTIKEASNALSISGGTVPLIDGGGISVGFNTNAHIELFAQQTPTVRFGLGLRDETNSDNRQHLNFVWPLSGGTSEVNMPYGDGVLALSVNSITANTFGDIALSLSGLSDTLLSGATHNYALIYNSGTTMWEAAQQSGVGGGGGGLQTIAYTAATGDFSISSGNTLNMGFEFVDTTSGFTFGSPDDKIYITGDLEFEAALTPGFEYTFPSKSGMVALLDDINYVTASTFNDITGDLTLEMLTGNTFVTNIGFTSGDTTNWNIAYNDSITGMTVTGTTTKTISLFQNDGGLIQANFTDEVGVGAGNDYVTGSTFDTGTGDLTLTRFSGGTVVENLDGRYSLTGHTHIEYDDYTTGATFNIADGVLTFTRQSGDTYNVDLDGRYSLTGHTHDISDITGFTDVYVTGSTFNTGDGVLEFTNITGGTFNVDLDGRYLTGETNSFVTGYTYSPTTNTFTIERNDGLSNLTALINTVTGFTINGDLTVTNTGTFDEVVVNNMSATTISATTINPVDTIQFNTGYTGNTVVEGLMNWDEDNQTVSLGLHTVNGDVSMQIGQEIY